MDRVPVIAMKNDLYAALAMTVRDRVYHSSDRTIETYAEHKPRVVAYLSAEFLPGPTLCEVLDYIASGALAGGDAKLFQPLVENLLRDDPFLLLADYAAYVDCQNQVSALWFDPVAWTRKAILNVARMGKFSSDRSIRDYCERVWNVTPSPVKVE
jgi:starch phosphorylase